mmetsp:Transcript_81895/g.236763  ORF Transcript_81895/g.236763 Transcript_81895/m.236763 type:complete len:319 (-) Transcript_81895:308-1264(-)
MHELEDQCNVPGDSVDDGAVEEGDVRVLDVAQDAELGDGLGHVLGRGAGGAQGHLDGHGRAEALPLDNHAIGALAKHSHRRHLHLVLLQQPTLLDADPNQLLEPRGHLGGRGLLVEHARGGHGRATEGASFAARLCIPRPARARRGGGRQGLHLELRLHPQGALLDDADKGLALVHFHRTLAQRREDNEATQCERVRRGIRLGTAEDKDDARVKQEAEQFKRPRDAPAHAKDEVRRGHARVDDEEQPGVREDSPLKHLSRVETHQRGHIPVLSERHDDQLHRHQDHRDQLHHRRPRDLEAPLKRAKDGDGGVDDPSAE